MKVTREDVIEAVRQADVVPEPDRLRDEVSLRDQGVDSLGVFNVLLVLEEKYGIQVPDEDIGSISSIDSILGYMNTRLV